MTVTVPGRRWSGSSVVPRQTRQARQPAAMCPDCALMTAIMTGAIRCPWCHLGRKNANRAAHAGAVVGAVAVRHLVQVLLVVVLGEVELAGRNDLGRDLAVAVLRQLLAVLGCRPLRGLPLCLTLVEDDGPVLAAGVVALA